MEFGDIVRIHEFDKWIRSKSVRVMGGGDGVGEV